MFSEILFFPSGQHGSNNICLCYVFHYTIRYNAPQATRGDIFTGKSLLGDEKDMEDIAGTTYDFSWKSREA